MRTGPGEGGTGRQSSANAAPITTSAEAVVAQLHERMVPAQTHPAVTLDLQAYRSETADSAAQPELVEIPAFPPEDPYAAAKVIDACIRNLPTLTDEGFRRFRQDFETAGHPELLIVGISKFFERLVAEDVRKRIDRQSEAEALSDVAVYRMILDAVRPRLLEQLARIHPAQHQALAELLLASDSPAGILPILDKLPVDHYEVALRFLREGYGASALFSAFDRFHFTDDERKGLLALLMSGHAESLIEHRELFPELDEQELVTQLRTTPAGRVALMTHLRKLSPFDAPAAKQEFMEQCIREGQELGVLEYIQEFEGVDFEWIMRALEDSQFDYALLRVARRLPPVQQQRIVDRMLAHDNGYQLRLAAPDLLAGVPDLADRMCAHPTGRHELQYMLDVFPQLSITVLHALLEDGSTARVLEQIAKFDVPDPDALLHELWEGGKLLHVTYVKFAQKLARPLPRQILEQLLQNYAAANAVAQAASIVVAPEDRSWLYDVFLARRDFELLAKNAAQFPGRYPEGIVDQALAANQFSGLVGALQHDTALDHADVCDRIIALGRTEGMVEVLQSAGSISGIDAHALAERIVARLAENQQHEVIARTFYALPTDLRQRLLVPTMQHLRGRALERFTEGLFVRTFEQPVPITEGLDLGQLAPELCTLPSMPPIAKHIEEFPPEHHAKLCEAVLERGSNADVRMLLSLASVKDGGDPLALRKRVAQRFLETNEYAFAVSRLEEYPEAEQRMVADRVLSRLQHNDDRMLADALLEHTAATTLDRAHIAEQLIAHGYIAAVLKHIDALPGLTHVQLAERLLREDRADALIRDLGDFRDLPQSIAERLVQDGYCADVVQHLPSLVPLREGQTPAPRTFAITNPQQLARTCITAGYGWALAAEHERDEDKFWERFPGLDPAALVEAMPEADRAMIARLDALVPGFSEVFMRNSDAVLSLWQMDRERLFATLEHSPAIRTAVARNPRFGWRLAVKYQELDAPSREKLDLLLAADAEFVAPPKSLDPSSLDYRLAMQDRLHGVGQNAEILMAAEERGIDVEAWLSHGEVAPFRIEVPEAVPLSERIAPPIGNILTYARTAVRTLREQLAPLRDQLERATLREPDPDAGAKLEEQELLLAAARASGDERRATGLARSVDALRRKAEGVERPWRTILLGRLAGIDVLAGADASDAPRGSLQQKHAAFADAEREFNEASAKDPDIVLRAKQRMAAAAVEVRRELAKLEGRIHELVDTGALLDRALAAIAPPDAPEFAATSRNALDAALREAQLHYGESLVAIERYFSGETAKTDDITGRVMSVATWARNPHMDAYQGNYSPCCISIEGGIHGSNSPIIDYITDLGMQVVNIIDEERGIPVVAAWCWLGIQPDGTTALVVDNVEANARYADAAPHQLWEQLRAYLTEYAARIGVQKLVLGMQYTKIPKPGTADETALPQDRTGWQKLGGYNPTERSDREYYRDTREQSVPRLVWSAPKEEVRETPRLFSAEDDAAILALEARIYPESVAEGPAMLAHVAAHDGAAFSTLLRGGDGELVGYALGLDTPLADGTPAAYLEDIAVAPEARGRGNGWALLSEFVGLVRAAERPAFHLHLRPDSIRLLDRHEDDIAALGFHLAEKRGAGTYPDGTPMEERIYRALPETAATQG